MNVPATSLSGFVTALALTLLHTLWQGAAAAGLLWAILKTLPAARARLRYVLACSALGATVMMGGITFTQCWPAVSGPARTGHAPPSISGLPPQAHSMSTASGRSSGKPDSSVPAVTGPTVIRFPEILPPGLSAGPEAAAEPAASGKAPQAISSQASPAASGTALPGTGAENSRVSGHRQSSAAAATQDKLFSAWMPWLTGLWTAGVLMGMLRLAGNWRVLRRWRGESGICPDKSLNAAFARLRKQLEITPPVRLMISAAAPVPLVIGWLRPVVLLPAGLLTGLSAAQLEALLVHELAHIRRWDFAINLLQSVVEIFFFHHPGVRWISSQIRAEREHCCDDMAAGLCGGPLPYARALAALEDLRAVDDETPPLCAAANGSPIASRIRRLAAPATSAAVSPLWPALVALTTLILIFGGLPWLKAQEKAGDPITTTAVQPAANNALTAIPEVSPEAQNPGSPPLESASAQIEPSFLKAREEREAQAWETVKAFLSASTASDKMRWLLPDEETQASAHTFFRRHPETAIAMTGTPFGPCMSQDDGQVTVAMEIPHLEFTYFFIVHPGAQAPRIDWLRSTCYLRQHFEDIRSDLPETPVRLQALIRSGDYYNNAFADKTRWRCYELIHPGIDRKFYGYEAVTAPAPAVKEGHRQDVQQEINLNLNPRPGIQTLEIKYPASQKDPSQVEIVRVLSEQPPHPSFAPLPGTSGLESLQRKTASEFRAPDVKFDPSGMGDWRYGDFRDFDKTSFDRVSLVPSNALRPSSEVILRVTDEKGAPGPDFRILMGNRFQGGGIAWIRPGPKPYQGESRWPRKYLSGLVAVRIEADGFVPELRIWEDAAKIPDEVAVALRPDKGVRIHALLPDGRPAAGARMALIIYGQQAEISGGNLPQADQPAPSTPYAAVGRPRFLQLDAEGYCLLPQEPDPQAMVIITHPSGVAETSHASLAETREIRLRPWARIQGRILNPQRAAGTLNAVRLSASGTIRKTPDMVLQEDHGSVTEDGGFIFEGVLPGMVEMTRMVADDPAAPEKLRPVEAVTPFRAEPGANRVTIDGDRLTLEAAHDDQTPAPAVGPDIDPSKMPPLPPALDLRSPPETQLPRSTASNGKFLDDLVLDYPDSLAAPKVEPAPPPSLVIVTDASTGKRVPSFKVLAGSVRINDTINWQRPENGIDGVTRMSLRLSDHGVLRVEAEGMMPQLQKWKTIAERPEKFAFELKPDAGVKRQIVLPDGSPAAGAAVALVIGNQGVLLQDGQLRSSDQPSSPPPLKPAPYARLHHTDSSGEFILPAEIDQAAPVIITHAAGILEIPYSKFLTQPRITLQPWAEIEGQAMWGKIPGTGVRITLQAERKPSVGDLALAKQTVTADADGKFVFRKVPPGTVMLYWELTENSSTGFGIKVSPGPNTALIGGRGRTVTGMLTGRPSWEGFSLALEPVNAAAAPPDKQYPPDVWQTLSGTWKSFRTTPRGGAYFKGNIPIAADGQFQIREVIPETYHLLLTDADGKTLPLSNPRSFPIAFEKPGETPAPNDFGQIPVPSAAEQH